MMCDKFVIWSNELSGFYTETDQKTLLLELAHRYTEQEAKDLVDLANKDVPEGAIKAAVPLIVKNLNSDKA